NAPGPEIIAAQVSPAPVPHEPLVFESPLAPVIFRATQKQPNLRYGSGAEMLAHLQALSPSPSSPGLQAPTAFGEVPEAASSQPRAPTIGHAATVAAPLPPTNPPITLPQLAPTAAAPVALAQAVPPPPPSFIGHGPISHAPTSAWAPPPPAEPAPSNGPPWVLITALFAGVLLIVATVVAVRMLRGEHPVANKPPPMAPGPRRPSALPRVRLAELTLSMIGERLKDAGYEVVNNTETSTPDVRQTTVTVRQGARAGMVFLFHNRNVEGARTTEETYRKLSSYAAMREGTMVLVTMMENGAEPGNARARELIAAIV